MPSKPKVYPKTYKPVNISKPDWEEYSNLAQDLTQKLGLPVSIPNMIRKAITFARDNGGL